MTYIKQILQKVERFDFATIAAWQIAEAYKELQEIEALMDSPMFNHLIRRIVEQRNKQQYINALAVANELQSLLLKEFADLNRQAKGNYR